MLGHLSFECRHDRLKSFDDLAAWIQNRIPDVLVIHRRGAATDKLNFLAINTFEFSPALLRSAGMARCTTELVLEQIAPFAQMALDKGFGDPATRAPFTHESNAGVLRGALDGAVVLAWRILVRFA